MPEQAPDLEGFGVRLASGPAFLLVGRSADRHESAAAQYRWSGIYTTRTDSHVAARVPHRLADGRAGRCDVFHSIAQ